jgi:hypothetical protein
MLHASSTREEADLCLRVTNSPANQLGIAKGHRVYCVEGFLKRGFARVSIVKRVAIPPSMTSSFQIFTLTDSVFRLKLEA